MSERYRKFFEAQQSRCQWHTAAWNLGDRFFGIGEYQIRLQAADRYSRVSRSRFASSFTLD